jgi:hypothetical protein
VIQIQGDEGTKEGKDIIKVIGVIIVHVVSAEVQAPHLRQHKHVLMNKKIV